MQHASWLLIAVISIRQTSEKQPTYNINIEDTNIFWDGELTKQSANFK
jgi:hypothetical protein